MKTQFQPHNWMLGFNQYVKITMSCRLAVIVAALAVVGSVNGAELIANGGFLSGLDNWKIGTNVPATFNPLIVNHAVSLHPTTMGPTAINGDILYQPLNVYAVGGKAATVTLKLMKNFAPSGSTIGVYLEYVTTGNAMVRLKAVAGNNDDFPFGEYTNVTGTVTLPANARKLTKLVVTKEDSGDFVADDFSVTMDGVTVGAVPRVESLSQVQGPYGTVVTVGGSGFGASAGQVQLGGSAAGANVQGWSDTAISVKVQEPSGGGEVKVLADYTESVGRGLFIVTSPHFTLSVPAPSLTVVKGEKARFLMAVNCYNGFVSTNGIQFLLAENPGIANFRLAPVHTGGGVIVELDTAALPVGRSTFTIQSLEEHSYARFVSVEVVVTTVSNIIFSSYDYPPVDYTGVVPVVKQARLNMSVAYTNNLGTRVADGSFGGQAVVTFTSSDPTRLLVFKGLFGYEFYANDNGAVTVTATAPDGFTKNFTFNIAVPDAPKVTSASVWPPVVSNSGTTTNSLYVSATESVGVSRYGTLNVVNGDLLWYNDNKSATETFQVAPGSQPGVYLFSGFVGGFGSTSAERFTTLTVENDASKGMFTGLLKQFSSGYMQEIYGVIEAWSTTQPDVVYRSTNMYFGNVLTFPYLPPDTYNIRFVPGTLLLPVWYPNAQTRAGASNVVVTAGQTVTNVDFLLFSSNALPTVAITDPLPGTTVIAGTNLTVSADAADSDGQVAYVVFMVDGALIGLDTTAPYSITYSNVFSGAHVLTALVFDNAGGSTLSAGIALTATGLTPPPEVVLSNPVLTPSGFSVSFNTEAGWTYTLLYKNMLSETVWSFGSSVAGDGTTMTLTDTTAGVSALGGASFRFYRVRAQR